MGDADEQAVEDQLESEGTGGARPSSSGVRPAEAAPEEAEPDATEDLQIIPIERDEEIIPAERAGRGPDQVARTRRTYREGEAQTPDPSDWTAFDISASLRGLRLSNDPKTYHPKTAPAMVACKQQQNDSVAQECRPATSHPGSHARGRGHVSCLPSVAKAEQ